MILYDVHTVAEPIRHFQQYPDPLQAQRMADHISGVIGQQLVVEPVDEPGQQPEADR